MLKISSSLWYYCWKGSTYITTWKVYHTNCLICFKFSYWFLVWALKWYWQVLLSFQNYLIYLFLTSCTMYESHTFVLEFWSSDHHLLYYPSCLSAFGKENKQVRKYPFSFPLLWPLLQLYHSHSVRWDHYYMPYPGQFFSFGVCRFWNSQRSNLAKVGLFPNYSRKRWDQFLKQHAVTGKNYLMKSCNISLVFCKAAICRKTWE